MTEIIYLLKHAVKAAIDAGTAIMRIYESGEYNTRIKSDESPVTSADLAANKIINEQLKSSGIPILSEENKTIPYAERKGWKEFWMIDPLDGTRDFLSRNGEFTVNIALIGNNYPVLGVIYVPVTADIYFSTAGKGSFRYKVKDAKEINTIINKADKLPLPGKPELVTVAVSRSHMDNRTEEFIRSKSGSPENINLISRGSSLKICMVAEGSADYYPRFGPTMEWDTAAGHAIARYAGKTVVSAGTGEELTYNKEDMHNPDFIVE